MFDPTPEDIEAIAQTAVTIFTENEEADYREWQFAELLREEVMAIRARRAMTRRPNRSEFAEIKAWVDPILRVYGGYMHPLPNWRDAK